MASDNRPISPHLQVYSWSATMALSILHRITGVGLGLGLLLLTWWLVAAASGPDYFDFVQGIMSSIIGRVIMFGFTLALFVHMCNGIRHLVWDAGYGFEIKSAQTNSVIVVVAAIALTIITFILGYSLR